MQTVVLSALQGPEPGLNSPEKLAYVSNLNLLFVSLHVQQFSLTSLTTSAGYR